MNQENYPMRVLQKLKLTSLLILMGLSFSHGVAAVGYFGTYTSTLWNTPAEFYTDEDWSLFESTLQKTLDTSPDGVANAWTNPKSKATGEFTVLKSLTRNGQNCREVKIIGSAGGLRRVTGIAFCKEDDGTWLAIPGRGRQ